MRSVRQEQRRALLIFESRQHFDESSAAGVAIGECQHWRQVLFARHLGVLLQNQIVCCALDLVEFRECAGRRSAANGHPDECQKALVLPSFRAEQHEACADRNGATALFFKTVLAGRALAFRQQPSHVFGESFHGVSHSIAVGRFIVAHRLRGVLMLEQFNARATIGLWDVDGPGILQHRRSFLRFEGSEEEGPEFWVRHGDKSVFDLSSGTRFRKGCGDCYWTSRQWNLRENSRQ